MKKKKKREFIALHFCEDGWSVVWSVILNGSIVRVEKQRFVEK